MVVFRWGVETQLDASAPFARGLVANLAIAAVLLVVVLINLYTASRLQRQIDQLAQQA
jgi:type II secretory pathway component PulL